MNTLPYTHLFLIKLGGSCITNKAEYCVHKDTVITQLLKELAEVAKTHPEYRFLLAHGAGGFGHILAKQHHISTGITTPEQRQAACQIHQDVLTLHQYIINQGLKEELPLFSFLHTFLTTGVPPSKDLLQCLQESLSNGLIPVFGGDIVLTGTPLGRVLSADTIIEHLGLALHQALPDRETTILHLSDVDGILDQEGQVIPEITPTDTPTHFFQKHPDVTGGMEEKYNSCARLQNHGINLCILNGTVPGRLKEELLGKRPLGTRFHPLTS